MNSQYPNHITQFAIPKFSASSLVARDSNSAIRNKEVFYEVQKQIQTQAQGQTEAPG